MALYNKVFRKLWRGDDAPVDEAPYGRLTVA